MSTRTQQIKQHLEGAISSGRQLPEIGKTIQRLRQAYDLSLGELAEQSGVSKSIISQIERNESNPTLSTIWRLSIALETSIENMLGQNGGDNFLEKLPAHLTPLLKSEDGLCTLRVLGSLNTVEWVQWYHFEAEAKGILESAAHESGSIEHLSVLAGTLEVCSGLEVRSARGGETLRYRCDREHSIRNTGDTPAQALLVVVLKSSVIQ